MTENRKQRWDAGHPVFVRDVLRTLIGLWLVSSGVCAIVFWRGFSGMLSGGLLGIALFLVAIMAGKAFSQNKQFNRIMLGLMLQQLLIWVVMALLLIVVKVHPVALIVGASMLPLSCIVTLVWYIVQRRRMPS